MALGFLDAAHRGMQKIRKGLVPHDSRKHQQLLEESVNSCGKNRFTVIDLTATEGVNKQHWMTVDFFKVDEARQNGAAHDPCMGK